MLRYVPFRIQYFSLATTFDLLNSGMSDKQWWSRKGKEGASAKL
jgi:hypothetical protein